ncbi:MAG: hypothetical protein H0W87_00715, partial [Actinobacteria bacterium]|nr:hypothetical protein [Actinomycetota bacterium]
MLVLPSTAAAWSGKRVQFAVGDAPGPAKYNTIWLRKYGPSSARTILVLIP